MTGRGRAKRHFREQGAEFLSCFAVGTLISTITLQD